MYQTPCALCCFLANLIILGPIQHDLWPLAKVGIVHQGERQLLQLESGEVSTVQTQTANTDAYTHTRWITQQQRPLGVWITPYLSDSLTPVCLWKRHQHCFLRISVSFNTMLANVSPPVCHSPMLLGSSSLSFGWFLLSFCVLTQSGPWWQYYTGKRRRAKDWITYKLYRMCHPVSLCQW